MSSPVSGSTSDAQGAPRSTLIKTASPRTVDRGNMVGPGRFHAADKKTHKTIDPLNVPEVRGKMLKKVVPSSLVPMATANAMLILGAQKKDVDCSFNLQRYLVWTGTIGLSLVIVGTIGRYVVRWILEDNKIRRGDKIIVYILEGMGIFLIAAQIAILCSGTLIIFPKLPYWQYTHKNLPNYCDFGMVIFMTMFVIVAWLMVLLALGSGIYIICYSNRREKPKDYRMTKTYFFEENP